MAKNLQVSLGQCSDKGRKPINQDFYGANLVEGFALDSKGITVALADGISSSQVSQIASETAVKSFIEDYYCTSDSWSVKTSAKKVLLATNSWLHAQTQNSQYRYNKDKGYVCTFSALIIKSTMAHLVHVGDSRIYHLRANHLEQLTDDHRVWESSEKSYLSRALGVNNELEIDYQSLVVEEGDVFILATDGIYEFISDKELIEQINTHAEDLDLAAKNLVEKAYANSSDDNLSIQIVRVESLPDYNEQEVYEQVTQLPFSPQLHARMVFDGYEIIRAVYISSRSHVYLAKDQQTQTQVIIKTPSAENRDNAAYLERFLLEEWIARRIDNEHVLKAYLPNRKRHYLYVVTEFIEGQTLAQWMIDNPKPDIETVRGIIEQLAKGLRAFHRQEMLHQDLRPNNIMIDQNGTVKIIDFGSTRVAGLMEITSPFERNDILGTAQYTAPEYFLGEPGTVKSDQFSLGVIAYQMLSGKLPYGTKVVNARTKTAQQKLRYQTVLDDERAIPAWVDFAIKKAVHPNPFKRYAEISEFIYELRHPSSTFLNQARPPIMERDPVMFWKSISLLLFAVVVYLLINSISSSPGL